MKLGLRGRLALATAIITFATGIVMAFVDSLPQADQSSRFELGIVVALCTALLNALLVTVATRRLTSALGALTRAAEIRTLGSALGGHLSERIGGADELEQLARALNRLSSDLNVTSGNLKDQRDLLSAVLEGMDEGVLLLDARGRVLTVNPALREMMLLGSETRGRPLLEVVRHAELKELVDAARTGGGKVSQEIDISGIKPRRLLVRAAPLEHAEGVLLAVFMDVTEIRRLETMRRDFVANVSHELRTPVASVRSAAETLRVAIRKDADAAPRFIDIIERNADRLQRLIEDLLDLSRIESREFRLNPEPVDLGAFYAHVAAMFRGRADERKVTLSCRVPPQLTALLDRRALEQVITNLVDNAVKYSPNTEVILSAEVDGSELRLAVEDHGPGIERKHWPRLFERFYRVDPGRSRDVGGTGLGLSIVKHLSEAMKGSVAVDSAPGQGTTFRVTLPYEPATPPERASLEMPVLH